MCAEWRAASGGLLGRRAHVRWHPAVVIGSGSGGTLPGRKQRKRGGRESRRRGVCMRERASACLHVSSCVCLCACVCLVWGEAKLVCACVSMCECGVLFWGEGRNPKPGRNPAGLECSHEAAPLVGNRAVLWVGGGQTAGRTPPRAWLWPRIAATGGEWRNCAPARRAGAPQRPPVSRPAAGRKWGAEGAGRDPRVGGAEDLVRGSGLRLWIES